MMCPAGLTLVKQQICWLVNMVLVSPPRTPSLSLSLPTLISSLARLPMFSQVVFLPPSLLTMQGGMVTQQLLDQSLVDAEILQEYMQRMNLIGWCSRSQFEECWMQLLQVLNAPPPGPEALREEHTAHLTSLCTGVRAATSLLLSTLLRPQAGNPSWSVLLHTHRNKDFNFLSSPLVVYLSVFLSALFGMYHDRNDFDSPSFSSSSSSSSSGVEPVKSSLFTAR